MPRFTFKKTERLCSRKAIEGLYEGGKSFYVSNLKILYRDQQEPASSVCRVVFSAPKKSFKRAVDRNLIKRRMREAYRLEKQTLYEALASKKIQVDMLVLYTAKQILPFEEIKKNVKQALKTLAEKATTAAV